jgi:hypothetical protein
MCLGLIICRKAPAKINHFKLYAFFSHCLKEILAFRNCIIPLTNISLLGANMERKPIRLKPQFFSF